MNKKCPLHGLKSKAQLYSMLGVNDKKLFRNGIQDKVKIYIAKDPKERLIEAPDYITKKAQKQVKNYLMKCDFPPYVFSGIKGKSYFNNAEMHLSSKYMYKTDISKFFPNISRDKVYLFFLNDLNTSPDVANILTNICTINISDSIETNPQVAEFVSKNKIRMFNHLCTGSPASPLLSYLVNRKMFDELNNIAENNGMSFSVYIDDVFFGSKKPIPYGVRQQILKTLTKHGYNISFKKVIYYKDKENKKVTGVIISPNNKLEIPNKLKLKIVSGFSKGNLKDSRAKINGMLIASSIIDKNSFNGIREYMKQLEKDSEE
ncbi:MAG: RNA-directed DNA polymerase [Eubacterium sp.]|nr:RNA-directed DNA polymerase [Eubacterium sp.]